MKANQTPRRFTHVRSAEALSGEMGQKYLSIGKDMAMRLWEQIEAGTDKAPRTRPYETIGYVIDGAAELVMNGRTIELRQGDSWVVPANVEHTYHILEPFTAIEVTSPPARLNTRDLAH